jgi:quercetin dioxygenase-like cupin family protein
MFIRNLAQSAVFRPDKMGKSDVASGELLFAGLNAFEPGQEHKLHAHAGQDKFYLVLEGSGEVTVGDETQTLSAGDAAFAAAGVPHSVRNTGSERLVILSILSPPPGGPPQP